MTGRRDKKEYRKVIEQTLGQIQIYTRRRFESSRREEMFHALALVREATRLLQTKSSRLSTVNANLHNVGGIDLSQLEIELTNSLRRIAIGSREGRQLYALRNRVRELLASDQIESAIERTAGGAA